MKHAEKRSNLPTLGLSCPVVLATFVTQQVRAENWASFTGAETLRDFVSDATSGKGSISICI